MQNPMAGLVKWFLSQNIVLYVSFVPAIAITFFVALIGFTRKRRS